MMRRKYHQSRARCLAIVGKQPANWTEAERYNRAARWLNRLVKYPAENGYALADGCIECPKCGKDVITYAEPQEWQRRDRAPKWQRRRHNRPGWQVTDYWGGTGECCGLLLAFQPDGRAECYSHND